MSIERVAELLERRPVASAAVANRYREQLFWLVDLIYACKTSGEPELVAKGAVVEEALGSLGEFLETGDHAALRRASAQVEAFAALVKAAVAAFRERKDGGLDGT